MTAIKLKFIGDYAVSSVDKHSVPNQRKVQVCNYVDVYYHDKIFPNENNKKATASEEELKKYLLRKGDVLITKDSEDWKDIGVPALVEETKDFFVCGYHLGIIRPYESVVPGYLFYFIKSEYGSHQLKVGSNGITRYGLNQDVVKNAFINLPPLPTQTRIAQFLDEKTALIDKAIAQKQRLIELLEERRQILIHQAVTRGLDPNVELRNSGVDWIGMVPKHWEVKRAKNLFKEVNDRSENGSETLISVSHLTGVSPRSEKNVTMFMAEDYAGSKCIQPGDLVINTMWAWMGALGVSRDEGIVSPAYGVYRTLQSKTMDGGYIDFLFRDQNYIERYNQISTGLHSSRLRLYPPLFFGLDVLLPPFEEQQTITRFCNDILNKSRESRALFERQIDKLKEYKSTLINAAVTGQIEV